MRAPFFLLLLSLLLFSGCSQEEWKEPLDKYTPVLEKSLLFGSWRCVGVDSYEIINGDSISLLTRSRNYEVINGDTIAIVKKRNNDLHLYSFLTISGLSIQSGDSTVDTIVCDLGGPLAAEPHEMALYFDPHLSFLTYTNDTILKLVEYRQYQYSDSVHEVRYFVREDKKYPPVDWNDYHGQDSSWYRWSVDSGSSQSENWDGGYPE